MNDLFGFLGMIDNYAERVVGRHEDENDERFYISTVAVCDSDDPFETAVAHPRYNEGKLVIVETYASRELAEAGHDEWVSKMTSSNLPKELIDVSTSGLADLCAAMGAAMSFPLQEANLDN